MQFRTAPDLEHTAMYRQNEGEKKKPVSTIKISKIYMLQHFNMHKNKT